MRHDPPPVMLFAAGFGTRMGALTKARPKPLIEVAGQALIDHALALLDGIQPPRIVANVHYLPELIEEHLAGTDVQTLREQPEILETGGGLRNALPMLQSDTVMTMNSDAIWAGPNPVDTLLDQWDPDHMDALLICVPISHVHGRKGAGDFCVADDGQLLRGAHIKPDVVYGGIQILKTDGLKDIAQTSFSLNVLWNRMAENGRLFGALYAGHWCDVGTPEGITEAETMLAGADV